MQSVVLRCMFLCMLMDWTLYACMLKNHTLWIEGHDCARCVAVNTTICSGYCYTQDTNLRGRFGRTFLIQRSCVPHSLVYRPAQLPDCPQDVNPQLHYPAAMRCSCKRCDTRSQRCIRTRRVTYDKCASDMGSKRSKGSKGSRKTHS